jgi:hypothetical protein
LEGRQMSFAGDFGKEVMDKEVSAKMIRRPQAD